MAISSWMIWGRSLRTSRPHRSRSDHESSCIQLDLSKGVQENIREVLTNLCLRQGVSSVKKLGYLNAIVRLISDNDFTDFGYSLEEILCCLRVGLVQEATQVRAAALRAIRYLVKKQEDVLTVNKLHYPYFIARSMDINLKNDIERMQALRLVRRILVLAPKHFSPVLARSLISLTNGGLEEKDRSFRVFLATLCELGVLNSNLLISCGGVGALTRAAMTGLSPAIIESIIGVLLRLLANPETRSSVSLMCLASPYCELHTSINDRSRENRETRFAASKQALLSVLRSYSGVINFCNPNDNAGLKAIADILYVEQLEVRGAVLELLYELLGLPLPMWTDEPDVALAAVDPCRQRENWKLSEGFVAAEGKSVLPSLASHCPNITELHLSLLVYILLECGLHRALAETIVSADTFISVRAAVLLGGLLHLAHSLLPPDVCDLTPPLPNLLEHASLGRHQALAAVTILGRMHAMMRRKPAPSSLFLDRILQSGTWLLPSMPRRQRTSSRNWLRRESPTTPLLKDAQVLSSKDALAWNWPVIRSILRSREDSVLDSDHKLFMKRLVRYFKPSSNTFSRVELITNASLARDATLAGCDLVNCLLEMHEPEGTRLLNELISDIADQINAIKTLPSAHECLFSPRHMTTTCCQKYFLFLGQLSHSAKGTVILKSFNLLEKLEDLAIATNHDCYVKLIISTLDYSRDGPNRKVLRKIISSASVEQTRLYATQFLRLILRAKITDACQWALSLIVDRLADDSKSVALAALEALHEMCEEPGYLESFFQQTGLNRAWEKWLPNLGDRGYLLFIRLYALQAGFTKLPSPVEELEKWTKSDGFSDRYVGLIEGEIHDSLTRRQRSENGSYPRRSSNMVILPRDVFIPPHLIGQFVQHELGLQLLMRRNVFQRFARIIQRFRPDIGTTDTESYSKATKSSRSFIDDYHLVSEESGAEDVVESITRLETIIDSEVMETNDCRTPRKTNSFLEIKRKLSVDDSQRTTPERSFYREDLDQHIDLDEKLVKVKSALWALGHAGTSPAGVEQLQNLGIIEMITTMAESCHYYSIRATAMYALSLISTNSAGADALTALNWPCVRYRRGDYWPVVPSTNPYTVPSPVPIQKHHRSLSDGKPELPEPLVRRTRNRSESAATDIEVKRYAFPERGETPSPVSSIQRLSQQDAEGYAKLRSLQRHRRPSYSHSSLEMYSSDGRLSLQSLSELESSRSWTTDNMLTTTPLPPPPLPPREEDPRDSWYMGICLPKNLSILFPHTSRSSLSFSVPEGESIKTNTDSSNIDEENSSEYDIGKDHNQICLVCYKKNINEGKVMSETDAKIQRDILRNTQRLSNPVLYRYSRQVLLKLRQSYPEKFQDTCIFSEIAARLGSGTYRLPARRFLQELLLDSPFDALYVEPMNILKIPVGTEENPAQGSIGLGTDSYTLGVSPLKRKVNGRLTIPEADSESSVATISELISDSQSLSGRLKSPEPSQKTEKLSDEKIIAEILKPAQRLRVSKSSDKLLKVTSKNTAISLD
ncbi:rapamycin-insensitive companion of mTOR [Chelonus insularis]|uniref:rapamycin-insensitive companion of mTOR n=1 Tax=Chelonus insularis TaxID=460826 RepID=UPI00158B2A3A|nr:rapamycin-insensitive companion of mTOR [Chelonus insularis]